MLRTVPALVALAILALAFARPPAAPTAEAPSPSDEVIRLRAHFDEVIRELEARGVSHMTAAQRRARASHIEALRGYAAAGIFPHNHDFAGEPLPYFVDEHGTLCAMAFLIDRSGGKELVERVAATRNNATIHELADTPELVAWLDANGLSVDEAARIQPSYDYRPPGEGETEAGGVSAGLALGSALASGVGGASIVLNLSGGPSEASLWEGLLGVAAGAAGVALGVETIDDGGAAATLGVVNAGIGVASAALGARTLFRLPGDARSDRASAERGIRVGASPLLATDGRAGVVFRAAF